MANERVSGAWRRVYEMLGTVPDTGLLMQARARELIRLHYEQIELTNMTGPLPLGGVIKPELLAAALEAGKTIEADITVKHNAASLA